MVEPSILIAIFAILVSLFLGSEFTLKRLIHSFYTPDLDVVFTENPNGTPMGQELSQGELAAGDGITLTLDNNTERELFIELELMAEVPGMMILDDLELDDFASGKFKTTQQGHRYKLNSCHVAPGLAHTRKLPIDTSVSERNIEVTVNPEVELSSFTIPLLGLGGTV